jgi:transglutaminase-like putative cysteine protease
MANRRRGPISWFIRQEFLQRAMAICVGVFLLQYIGWMIKEEYVWQKETASLIKYTLLALGITYLIPKIPILLRGLIQIIVIFVITAFYFDYQFVPLLKWDWDQVLPFIDQNFGQLLPYLWFALGTWLVYAACIWIMSIKLSMYIGIIGSIIALCIRDSFSNLSLWREIAVVLFCSTLIVVISNMLRIQKQAPDAWNKLSKRPFPIVIPIVLFALIFYSIVQYTPPIRPILTDPYTAWKNYNGEQVARFVSEDGGFLGTNQEASAESGYSREDSQLGGGFQFNYRNVMKVNSTHRSYWRGETRSMYTGTGWEKYGGELGNRSAVGPGQLLQSDPNIDTSKATMRTVKYTVTMSTEEAYPVLFGPNQIGQLEKLEGKNTTNSLEKLSWTPNDAVMNFDGNSNYPTSYTMISQVPIIDVEGLRTVKLEDISAEEWAVYLLIPETMPARVRDLAEEITKNSATPYDKVKNIEQYLANNFTYNTNPAKGSSHDFVDQFLFEVKEGYCDYYSTSMVMLARSIGMPARWVKGFSTGTSLLEEMMERGGYRGANELISQSEDEYTVRNADAHSWVEVYFPGWGWIPFEPTAGFRMPAVSADDANAPAPTPILADNLPVEESLETNWNWRAWTFFAGLIVLVVLIIFMMYRYIPWGKVFKLLKRARYAGNYNQMVLNDMYRLLHYAKRKGYDRLDNETTIRETLTRWMHQSVWLERELQTLLHQYERANYSGSKITEKEWYENNRNIRKVKIAMK